MNEPIGILFSDATRVAVAKPPGLPVVPARGDDRDCVRARLEAQLREPLFVVHRLDRDTSGVLLFARTAAAHRELSIAFERHQVRKHYLAITRGAPAPPGHERRVDLALHTARKGKMRPAQAGEPGAQRAVTLLRVERVWPGEPVLALVGLSPETGRQHQLRVHLRYLDCALLVDPQYGRASRITRGEIGIPSDAGEVVFDRLTLHADELALPDGTTIRAPPPADWQRLVALLDTRA